jgi:hypothetical protein
MPSKKLTTQLVQGAHTACNGDSQSAIYEQEKFYSLYSILLQPLGVAHLHCSWRRAASQAPLWVI